MLIRDVDERIVSARKPVAEEQRCGTCVHARAPERVGSQTYLKCALRSRRVSEEAPSCASWQQAPEAQGGQSPWAVNGVEPIGIIIARAREQLRATQEEYAEQMGVDKRTLQRWESLEQVPQPTTADAIGEVVGLVHRELVRSLQAQRAAVIGKEGRL